MYNPVTRLLTILHLLHTHPSLSAQALAEKAEVSTRTVRRYVTMLRDMGIPVEVTMGASGGYYLQTWNRAPPPYFSPRELEILLEALSRVEDAEVNRHEIDALRDKILWLLR